MSVITAPPGMDKLRDIVTGYKWPLGFTDSIIQSGDEVAYRFVIVDNSRSMHKHDFPESPSRNKHDPVTPSMKKENGLQSPSNIKSDYLSPNKKSPRSPSKTKFPSASNTKENHPQPPTPKSPTSASLFRSRWEEVSESVGIIATLADAAGAPMEIQLLDDSAPMLLSRVIDDGSILAAVAEQLVAEPRPTGSNQRCKQLEGVGERLRYMEADMIKKKKTALLVIMTDGKSRNSSMVDALRSLSGLPLQVIVRICTEEQDVIEHWQHIISQVDLDMFILNELRIEALNVAVNNPWMTYGEPLHRLREFGVMEPALDLLGCRQLRQQEIRTVSRTLVNTEAALPAMGCDWSKLTETVSEAARDCTKIYCPVERQQCPWIKESELSMSRPDSVRLIIEANESLLWSAFVSYSFNASLLKEGKNEWVTEKMTERAFRSAARYEKQMLSEDDCWQLLGDFHLVPAVINTLRWNKVIAQVVAGRHKKSAESSKLKLCFREFITMMVQISSTAYSREAPPQRLLSLLHAMVRSGQLERIGVSGEVRESVPEVVREREEGLWCEAPGAAAAAAAVEIEKVVEVLDRVESQEDGISSRDTESSDGVDMWRSLEDASIALEKAATDGAALTAKRRAEEDARLALVFQRVADGNARLAEETKKAMRNSREEEEARRAASGGEEAYLSAVASAMRKAGLGLGGDLSVDTGEGDAEMKDGADEPHHSNGPEQIEEQAEEQTETVVRSESVDVFERPVAVERTVTVQQDIDAPVFVTEETVREIVATSAREERAVTRMALNAHKKLQEREAYRVAVMAMKQADENKKEALKAAAAFQKEMADKAAETLKVVNNVKEGKEKEVLRLAGVAKESLEKKEAAALRKREKLKDKEAAKLTAVVTKRIEKERESFPLTVQIRRDITHSIIPPEPSPNSMRGDGTGATHIKRFVTKQFDDEVKEKEKEALSRSSRISLQEFPIQIVRDVGSEAPVTHSGGFFDFFFAPAMRSTVPASESSALDDTYKNRSSSSDTQDGEDCYCEEGSFLHSSSPKRIQWTINPASSSFDDQIVDPIPAPTGEDGEAMEIEEMGKMGETGGRGAHNPSFLSVLITMSESAVSMPDSDCEYQSTPARSNIWLDWVTAST